MGNRLNTHVPGTRRVDGNFRIITQIQVLRGITKMTIHINKQPRWHVQLILSFRHHMTPKIFNVIELTVEFWVKENLMLMRFNPLFNFKPLRFEVRL